MASDLTMQNNYLRIRRSQLPVLLLLAVAFSQAECVRPRLHHHRISLPQSETRKSTEICSGTIQKLAGSGSGPSSPGNRVIAIGKKNRASSPSLSSSKANWPSSEVSNPEGLLSGKNKASDSDPSSPGNTALYSDSKSSGLSLFRKDGTPSGPSSPGNAAISSYGKISNPQPDLVSSQPISNSNHKAVSGQQHVPKSGLSRKTGPPSMPSGPGNAEIY